MSGIRFGSLVVIKRIDKPDNKTRGIFWLCRCDCNPEKDVIKTSSNLLYDKSTSCGCMTGYNISKTKRSIEYRTRNNKYNTYDLTGEYGIGYTTKGEEFYFDLEDYDLIKGYYWSFNKNKYVYAYCFGYKNRILMHRLIMNVTNKQDFVDHIKHIQYDNRKSQLRVVNNQKNMLNRSVYNDSKSGVTGVTWDSEKNLWRSRIINNGYRIHLGYYEDINEAIIVRKEAEEKYFGEYSYDNSMKR